MDDGFRVRYATTLDGTHLAYRTKGSGPVDLVEVGGFGALFSLASGDDLPQWVQVENQLARFGRLVRFDPRGIGLSDGLAGRWTLDQAVDDVVAVMDAAGSQRAAVLATGWGGPVGIRLAARYPDRVDRLVLVNTWARWGWAQDYPVGERQEQTRERIEGADPKSAQDSDLHTMAPMFVEDAQVQRWWARESRRGASPAVVKTLWDTLSAVDVRTELPGLRMPVLVLSSVDNRFIGNEVTEWLSRHIPGCRYVEVSGAGHVLWAMPDGQVIPEIEEFVTGNRSTSVGRGALIAILFTDIVDSTARNNSDGDQSWIERLANHDALTRRQISRFGGTHIKSLGDGVLATFPTPTLALEAARDITVAAEDIGVAIRASVHAAEVRLIDGDVLGLGVTIAARLLAHADGGQIVTTSTVVELLTGSSFEFEQLGTHGLKGVPGRWTLFKLATP